MSFSINAFNHAEWDRLGLADFSDFADQITECNVGEDAFSGFGEWFFIPEQPLPMAIGSSTTVLGETIIRLGPACTPTSRYSTAATQTTWPSSLSAAGIGRPRRNMKTKMTAASTNRARPMTNRDGHLQGR